jgi:hypothetical protein
MAVRIFLTFWLLAAAVCFVGFYYAWNKGWVESLPPSIEAIVDEPLGVLLLFFVSLILGPTPIAAIKIRRKKPGQPTVRVNVDWKEE